MDPQQRREQQEQLRPVGRRWYQRGSRSRSSESSSEGDRPTDGALSASQLNPSDATNQLAGPPDNNLKQETNSHSNEPDTKRGSNEDSDRLQSSEGETASCLKDGKQEGLDEQKASALPKSAQDTSDDSTKDATSSTKMDELDFAAPMKRVYTPEEVAAIVAFANKWMPGRKKKKRRRL